MKIKERNLKRKEKRKEKKKKKRARQSDAENNQAVPGEADEERLAAAEETRAASKPTTVTSRLSRRMSVGAALVGDGLSALQAAGRQITQSLESEKPELSAFDRSVASQLFRKSAGGVDGQIDKEKFRQLLIDLTEKANRKAKKEGIKLTPIPKEKYLDAAFDGADDDDSGTMDEDEFLSLYRDIKSGSVKGFSGKFFSAKGRASTAHKKTIHYEDEDLEPPMLAIAPLCQRSPDVHPSRSGVDFIMTRYSRRRCCEW